jgi:hypothetical protein
VFRWAQQAQSVRCRHEHATAVTFNMGGGACSPPEAVFSRWPSWVSGERLFFFAPKHVTVPTTISIYDALSETDLHK